MRLLFCVEFYFPSIGGAQEVMRQIAERLAARGHSVTVATTRLTGRVPGKQKGVQIEEFAVSGNRVRGLSGEVDRYRRFLLGSHFELVFFYAAQQWAFDAAWEVLDQLTAKSVLVPCGYSGLFEPAYQEYFAELPEILRKLDLIVYHASAYRDFEFGRSHGLDKFAIIPNGADEREFAALPDSGFRSRHGIPAGALILLTVGTVTGLKGHLEVTRAFDALKFDFRPTVLLLNGNSPLGVRGGTSIAALIGLLTREYSLRYALKHVVNMALSALNIRAGKQKVLVDLIDRINRLSSGKRVIRCDLPRVELIQAYQNADLFVFASNIEYSPLVLFEACAASLAFLSVSVGNAAEIAEWTGGGEIVPVTPDDLGYVRVAPEVFAERIDALLSDQVRRQRMRECGRASFERKYNWEHLSAMYEARFLDVIDERAPGQTPRAHVALGERPKAVGEG